MSDTPETDAFANRGFEHRADELCKLYEFASSLERQRDEAVALNYAKAEIIDELADILNMPTGATDEEIGEAASEAIRQRDALKKKLDQKEKAHQVTRDTARRLSAQKHQAAHQRDAYAETLRQVLVYCNRVTGADQDKIIDAIRERHPELGNAGTHPSEGGKDHE